MSAPLQRRIVGPYTGQGETTGGAIQSLADRELEVFEKIGLGLSTREPFDPGGCRSALYQHENGPDAPEQYSGETRHRHHREANPQSGPLDGPNVPVMPAGRFASSPGATTARRHHRSAPPPLGAITARRPSERRGARTRSAPVKELMSRGSCQGAYLEGPSMAFELNRSTRAFGPPAGGWKAADSRCKTERRGAFSLGPTTGLPKRSCGHGPPGRDDRERVSEAKRGRRRCEAL